MLFQKIARQFSFLPLVSLIAVAAPACADSAVVSSDMMLSGPSTAAPIHLTMKHPKNTPMHVTIVTDTSAGGVVEFSAPETGSPIIAYAFPAKAARNVKVFDGRGQEVWRLIGGEVNVSPNDDAGSAQAMLTQLDRAFTVTPAALAGFYALKIHSDSDFYSTTDIARINSAGTHRLWAHHRSPLALPPQGDSSTVTTIVISPTAYVSTLSTPRPPAQ